MPSVWAAFTSIANHLPKDTAHVLLRKESAGSELPEASELESLPTWHQGNLDRAVSLLPHLCDGANGPGLSQDSEDIMSTNTPL